MTNKMDPIDSQLTVVNFSVIVYCMIEFFFLFSVAEVIFFIQCCMCVLWRKKYEITNDERRLMKIHIDIKKIHYLNEIKT